MGWIAKYRIGSVHTLVLKVCPFRVLRLSESFQRCQSPFRVLSSASERTHLRTREGDLLPPTVPTPHRRGARSARARRSLTTLFGRTYRNLSIAGRPPCTQNERLALRHLSGACRGWELEVGPSASALAQKRCVWVAVRWDVGSSRLRAAAGATVYSGRALPEPSCCTGW